MEVEKITQDLTLIAYKLPFIVAPNFQSTIPNNEILKAISNKALFRGHLESNAKLAVKKLRVGTEPDDISHWEIGFFFADPSLCEILFGHLQVSSNINANSQTQLTTGSS